MDLTSYKKVLINPVQAPIIVPEPDLMTSTIKDDSPMTAAEYQQFVAYYEAYKNKIHSYLWYRLNQDTQTAEDLTADTFIKAFEKWHQFDSSRAFGPWIYTIARNTLWDYFRVTKPTEEIEESPIEYDFADLLDNADQKEKVKAAIEQLPLKQKEVLILKYMEDWTTREISEELHLSQPAIRQILHRSIKKLRSMLKSLIIFIG